MKARSIVIAALFAASAFAPLAAQAGEVTNREVRQENRIYAGVRSGSLTSGQYDRLQAAEGRLNDRRLNDLRANGGRLTAGEFYRLNRQENRLSKRIYVDKH